MKSRRDKFILGSVFALPVLALAAGTILFSIPARSARFDFSDGGVSLEKRADAYLRQTSRILGSRFNEEFYRSVVRTESEETEKLDWHFDCASRECFARLAPEADEDIAEALAFLDEVEEDKISVSFPDQIFCTTGNPISVVADWLTRPLVFRYSSFGEQRTATAVPFYTVLHFLFVHISIPVGIFLFCGPVLCSGIAEIKEILRQIVPSFSVSHVFSGSVFRKTREEHLFSFLPTFSDEKMTVVLLL